MGLTLRTHTHRDTQRDTEREGERGRETHTETHTQRHTHKHTHRDTETHTHKQSVTSNGFTHIQTHIQAHPHAREPHKLRNREGFFGIPDDATKWQRVCISCKTAQVWSTCYSHPPVVCFILKHQRRGIEVVEGNFVPDPLKH